MMVLRIVPITLLNQMHVIARKIFGFGGARLTSQQRVKFRTALIWAIRAFVSWLKKSGEKELKQFHSTAFPQSPSILKKCF